MYIFERVMGVLIYSIGLFFAYRAIKQKASVKKVLIVYVVFLTLLAFIYIPGDNADLVRLRIWMNEIATMSTDKYHALLGQTSVPLFYIFSRIFGGIRLQSVVPAIAALVSYSCSFYMLYKTSKNFKTDNKDTAISLLVFMSCGQYLQLISDIRSQMVFFIIAFLSYREIVENKKILWHIPVYLLCVLFHQSAVALIGVRLLLGFFTMKKQRIIYKVLYALFSLAIVVIIFTNGNIIESFYEKAFNYLSTDNYSFFWTYLTSWISIIVSLSINLYLKGAKNMNPTIANFAKYSLLFNIVTICFSFEYNIFIRFQAYSEIINLALYPLIVSTAVNRKRAETSRRVLKTTAILLLSISCSRGDLSGYKFMKLE